MSLSQRALVWLQGLDDLYAHVIRGTWRMEHAAPDVPDHLQRSLELQTSGSK
jgi:hypothetical protein